MAFPWAEKKDADKDEANSKAADQPSACAGDEPAQLHQLLARLGEIEALVGHTTQQVVAYLIHRQSKLSAAGESGSGAITERLDQIEARLKSLSLTTAVPEPSDSLAAAVGQLRESVHEQQEALSTALRQLRQQLEDGLARLAECRQPAPPDEPAATSTTGADWQRALLGKQLAEDPALDFQRQQLCDGVLEGHPAACSLVGQMLVFQSSPAEKMPALLKDIGEAFYRWQAKTKPGASKLEEALVSWLQKTADEAGIANTIELVHPGERFDAARHSADGRGVEITEVRGWIVLRDNGKVYTKASVGVK